MIISIGTSIQFRLNRTFESQWKKGNGHIGIVGSDIHPNTLIATFIAKHCQQLFVSLFLLFDSQFLNVSVCQAHYPKKLLLLFFVLNLSLVVINHFSVCLVCLYACSHVAPFRSVLFQFSMFFFCCWLVGWLVGWPTIERCCTLHS